MIYYIITDGNGSYIRKDDFSNKYVPIRNKNFAEKWRQRNKADNVLKNALSKDLRPRYKIIEIEEIYTEPSPPQVEVRQSEPVMKVIAKEPVECDQMTKWSSRIETMKACALDAELRKEELIAHLSEVDKEISDIYHYIELGKFNAYQGYLAFDMLRQRLKKRRKIKNELQVLTQLGECKISSAMLSDINRAIENLENKQYTPRVLTELFS